MNCPVCGGKVGCLDTRSDCEAVYRRRGCKECGHIFYTSEVEMPSSKRDFRITAVNNRKNGGVKND